MLTDEHKRIIDELMKKNSEIVLQPRRDGYIIYEMKKKVVYRPEKKTE